VILKTRECHPIHSYANWNAARRHLCVGEYDCSISQQPEPVLQKNAATDRDSAPPPVAARAASIDVILVGITTDHSNACRTHM
jgi:hypothetical protein